MSESSHAATAAPETFNITRHLDPQQYRSASWPLGKVMAMMKLRNSEVSLAVLESLQSSTARAGADEYDDLVREGYAYRTWIRNRLRLILYPTAHFEADELARAWAKELGLHILISRAHTRRKNNSTISDICSCGQTFSYRKGWNTLRSNGAGFIAHLEDVKAGRWKPYDAQAFPAKLSAQMEEVIARRRAPG